MNKYGSLSVRCAVVCGVLFGWASATRAAPADCERLAGLKLAHTSVALAQVVAAGAFVPPGAAPSEKNAEVYKSTPAFCRVVIHARPTTDSDIQIEIWMPMANWNGKFQGEGNGGFAGSIGYNQLAAAVTSGYASAGTNTGHQADGQDASWAFGHPEKIVDFGYRAIHEMTEQAKAVVHAFYGREARKSYFVACSDGGREALMEAQRFPGDFDGILAGAPANYWTHLLTSGDDLSRQAEAPGNAIPDAKIPAISAAVLAACDGLDGVKDGILTDPRKCHFDPMTIECKGAETTSCLTSPQVSLLKRLYAGGKTAKGEQVFPGYLSGGEEGEGGWKNWILGGATPGQSSGSSYVKGYFQNMVYTDREWKPGTHSVDDDLRAAEEKTAHALDSNDPDMSAFAKRGGKLIVYHGWNDPAISALNSINYYEAVKGKMGDDAARQFMRLYLVPGMQHCTGGPGPSLFGQFSVLPQKDEDHSIYLSLERWVETGSAPGSVIAEKASGGETTVAMRRPICPYPQIAKYKGSGDPNAAENFQCAAE